MVYSTCDSFNPDSDTVANSIINHTGWSRIVKCELAGCVVQTAAVEAGGHDGPLPPHSWI